MGELQAAAHYLACSLAVKIISLVCILNCKLAIVTLFMYKLPGRMWALEHVGCS